MDITGMHPYQLAHRVGCWHPDSGESPGAEYLVSIARAVSDALAVGDYGLEDYGDDIDAGNMSRATDTATRAADEIATDLSGINLAGGLACSTFNLWRVFVDLGAWQQDPDECPAGPENIDPMTRDALARLWLIGYRLALALLTEWADERADLDADAE